MGMRRWAWARRCRSARRWVASKLDATAFDVNATAYSAGSTTPAEAPNVFEACERDSHARPPWMHKLDISASPMPAVQTASNLTHQGVEGKLQWLHSRCEASAFRPSWLRSPGAYQ